MAETETTVVRGAAALYAANITTLGLNTLYLVLLTNFVSLQKVGIVSLLNVIIVGVATLSVLALPLTGTGVSATPPAVTRFISQYVGEKGSARRVYFFSAAICLILSLAALAVLSLPGVAGLIAPVGDSHVVVLAGVDAVLYSFAQLGGYSLLGAGRATLAGKLMIVSATLRYVAASVLLLAGFGLPGVFIGFAVGDAVMAGVANFSSYGLVSAARTGAFSAKPVLTYMASVFVAAAMGFAVSQTDKLLAFFQQGLGNLALYNIAAVGAAVASFAPNAATNVLVPAMSGRGKTLEQKRETLRVYTRHVTLTAAPMGFELAAISPFLLRVFGDTYSQAAPLMAAISISISLTAVTSVYASILLVDDRAHDFALSSLVALLGLVAVALATVPSLQLFGVALGRSAMLFIMLGAVAFFVWKRRLLVLDSQAYVKSVLASAAMALLSYAVLDSAATLLPLGRFAVVGLSVVMMPLGLAFYLLAMKWLKAFNASDVEFVEAIFPKWLRWFALLARKLL